MLWLPLSVTKATLFLYMVYHPLLGNNIHEEVLMAIYSHVWHVHMGNEIIYEDMYGKSANQNSVPVAETFRIIVQGFIFIRKRWNSSLK